MSETERERVTVPVKVHPRIRAEWHRFVAESDEFASVSDLIRRSVVRQMDGMYDPTQTQDVDLEPVLERLEDFDDRLTDISEDMQTVKLRGTNDPISSMATDIRNMIPQVEDPTTMEELGSEMLTLPVSERIATFGEVSDIISYFSEDEDMSEMQVRRAIDRLTNDFPSEIHRVQIESEEGKSTVRLCRVQ